MLEFGEKLYKICNVLKKEPEELERLIEHCYMMDVYSEEGALVSLNMYIYDRIPLIYSCLESVDIYSILLDASIEDMIDIKDKASKLFRTPEEYEFAYDYKELTYGIIQKRTLFGHVIEDVVTSDAIAEIYRLKEDAYYLDFGNMANFVKTATYVDGELYTTQIYNRGASEEREGVYNEYWSDDVFDGEVISEKNVMTKKYW